MTPGVLTLRFALIARNSVPFPFELQCTRITSDVKSYMKGVVGASFGLLCQSHASTVVD